MVSHELRVGVLALQGAFEPHVARFAALGVRAREVREPAALEDLTHLVLPGGESTTIHRLLELFELREPLVRRVRAGELALFGVCAGAILLARDDGADRPPRLGLLDVGARRNAYGRQLASETLRLRLEGLGRELDCVFIRAPLLVDPGPLVRVLGRRDGDPILVEGPGVLACTFHPELTADDELHRRFLALRGAPATAAPPPRAVPSAGRA